MIEPSRMSCVVIRDRAYHALQDAVRRTGRAGSELGQRSRGPDDREVASGRIRLSPCFLRVLHLTTEEPKSPQPRRLTGTGPWDSWPLTCPRSRPANREPRQTGAAPAPEPSLSPHRCRRRAGTVAAARTGAGLVPMPARAATAPDGAVPVAVAAHCRREPVATVAHLPCMPRKCSIPAVN
jgi:hypothetical protein